jgi:hypothetical protein
MATLELRHDFPKRNQVLKRDSQNISELAFFHSFVESKPRRPVCPHH